MNKLLPGTLEIFDLPLFPLLDDRPLSLRSVQRHIAAYRKEDEWGFSWAFPNSSELPPCPVPDETYWLLNRGDLWGAFGILALIREAEASGDGGKHIACCKDLYRILIRLAKTPWIAPAIPLLRSCIDDIRARVHLSTVAFDVDWSVLEEAKGVSGEVDVIWDAELVPGSEIRRRKMRREAKAAKRE